MSAEKAPLRVQHGAQAAEAQDMVEEPSLPRTGRPGGRGLGRVRTPAPGRSVRVTVRLGLAPNALAFWRRRSYRTSRLFAEALTEATGVRITAAYVRYWESAVGVPPAVVVEAVAKLLKIPPTLIWAQEQLALA